MNGFLDSSFTHRVTIHYDQYLFWYSSCLLLTTKKKAVVGNVVVTETWGMWPFHLSIPFCQRSPGRYLELSKLAFLLIAAKGHTVGSHGSLSEGVLEQTYPRIWALMGWFGDSLKKSRDSILSEMGVMIKWSRSHSFSKRGGHLAFLWVCSYLVCVGAKTNYEVVLCCLISSWFQDNSMWG
jgi:hypothetical protein